MFVEVWFAVKNFLGSASKPIVSLSIHFLERLNERLRMGKWNLTVLSTCSPD